mmetsp:Transcript_26704/g.67298  ORF Transcript_26704/g.67298 Transcript_26704/m.67298 type:complete len:243 (+) Transcript_26704:6537-7265(+)
MTRGASDVLEGGRGASALRDQMFVKVQVLRRRPGVVVGGELAVLARDGAVVARGEPDVEAGVAVEVRGEEGSGKLEARVQHVAGLLLERFGVAVAERSHQFRDGGAGVGLLVQVVAARANVRRTPVVLVGHLRPQFCGEPPLARHCELRDFQLHFRAPLDVRHGVGHRNPHHVVVRVQHCRNPLAVRRRPARVRHRVVRDAVCLARRPDVPRRQRHQIQSNDRARLDLVGRVAGNLHRDRVP